MASQIYTVDRAMLFYGMVRGWVPYVEIMVLYIMVAGRMAKSTFHRISLGLSRWHIWRVS
jgi:hypothetical protein